MSKQVTRWSPDTCKCVIEYEWDDTHLLVLEMAKEGGGAETIARELGLTPAQVIDMAGREENRVHTHHASIQTCSRHAQHHGKSEHFDTVLEENQRKNRVRSMILDSVPAVAAARIQENGEAVMDFHPEKPFAYEFDGDGVLHVTVAGMTAASRKKVQTAANKAHGANKVVIH